MTHNIFDDETTMEQNTQKPIFSEFEKGSILSSRFYYLPQRSPDTKFIVSISKNRVMRFYTETGEQKSKYTSDYDFTAMTPLRNKDNSQRIGIATDALIIAGVKGVKRHKLSIGSVSSFSESGKPKNDGQIRLFTIDTSNYKIEMSGMVIG